MARAPDAVIILNAIGQIILVKPQTECWLWGPCLSTREHDQHSLPRYHRHPPRSWWCAGTGSRWETSPS